MYNSKFMNIAVPRVIKSTSFGHFYSTNEAGSNNLNHAKGRNKYPYYSLLPGKPAWALTLISYLA